MYQVRTTDSKLKHIEKDFLSFNQAREYAYNIKNANPNSTIRVFRCVLELSNK